MSINLSDVISLKSRGLLQEINTTLDELVPLAERLMQEGYPLTKQLENLYLRREWNEKMLSTFKVPKLIQT